MGNKIVCVLTNLKPSHPAKEGAAAQRNTIFAVNNKSYPIDRQTNISPIEAILDYQKANGQTVDSILCFSSDECRVLVQDAGTDPSCSATTEVYFAQKIGDYCAGNNISQPSIDFIPYSTEHGLLPPLHELLSKVGESDHFDFDMTGGGRDGIMLILLAMEAMKYRGISHGLVLYSNLNGSPVIKDQARILGLIDFIKSLDAFSRFGKASGLHHYFQDTKNGLIREFSEALHDFSDSISLCRTKGLVENIDKIHSLMDEIERQEYSPQAPAEEMLLRTLMPAMRDNFVRTSGDGMTEVSLIEWCAQNEMLQQALSFVREMIPEMLHKRRILQYQPEWQDVVRNKKKNPDSPAECMNELVQSISQGRITPLNQLSESGDREQFYLLFPLPNGELDSFVKCFVSSKTLSDICIYQTHLRNVRNVVDHVAEDTLSNRSSILEETLFRQRKLSDIRNLQSDALAKEIIQYCSILRLADKEKSPLPRNMEEEVDAYLESGCTEEERRIYREESHKAVKESVPEAIRKLARMVVETAAASKRIGRATSWRQLYEDTRTKYGSSFPTKEDLCVTTKNKPVHMLLHYFPEAFSQKDNGKELLVTIAADTTGKI